MCRFVPTAEWYNNVKTILYFFHVCFHTITLLFVERKIVSVFIKSHLSVIAGVSDLMVSVLTTGQLPLASVVAASNSRCPVYSPLISLLFVEIV